MKCRVYCKHETFVSLQIVIKIVINKCNIVNSLFIAFKFQWVFIARSATYFTLFSFKVQINVLTFLCLFKMDECLKLTYSIGTFLYSDFI